MLDYGFIGSVIVSPIIFSCSWVLTLSACFFFHGLHIMFGPVVSNFSIIPHLYTFFLLSFCLGVLSGFYQFCSPHSLPWTTNNMINSIPYWKRPNVSCHFYVTLALTGSDYIIISYFLELVQSIICSPMRIGHVFPAGLIVLNLIFSQFW